jgi:DNA-binding MarR family transcriptional regulator
MSSPASLTRKSRAHSGLRRTRAHPSPDKATAKLISDFLGSAQVLASSVNQVVEKRLLREVAGSRLSFSQCKLLKLVALKETHTLGDVAVFLGISHAAASKAVDKLVRRKLLRRTEGQPDRRAIQLSPTETSRRLLAAYDDAKNKKLAKILRQFSPAELHRTAALLDRLAAGLIDHSASPDQLCLQCGIYFRDKCLLRDLTRRTCFYQQQTTARNGPPAPGEGSGKGSKQAQRPRARRIPEGEEEQWPKQPPG